ncbi:MAG: nucleotidyltransferase family protein [Planctomycetota bacterium]|nr:MAG: nucleotidyltransferase family protein [Planctomycetota bacterium]
MRHFAIIPAAGLSRRMPGGDKLLLPWGPVTIIEAVLRAWSASRVDRVIVVARRDDVALHRHVVHQPKTSLVLPAENPSDMRTSIAQGLQFARRHCAPSATDRWMVAPADLPTLSPVLIDHVIEQAETWTQHIVLPDFSGKGGHPISLPWDLSHHLLALPPDQGLNALKASFPMQSFDAGAIGLEEPADIDTSADYQRLKPGP